jgi:hypothetical protein
MKSASRSFVPEYGCTMKIVEVRWWDAFIDTDDMSIKKAKNLKPVERFTVGYLVAENEHGIVLSTDYFPRKTKVTEISATMVIPWGMIEYWEVQDV